MFNLGRSAKEVTGLDLGANSIKLVKLEHKAGGHVLRALGVREWRILWRHVAPNCLNPLIVSFTMGIATTILAEASLSFLGLGAQPPTPSWGQMVSTGKDFLRAAPWVSFFPGLFLALTVLALNLVGDSVRDALDPRLKRRARVTAPSSRP